MNKRLTYFNCSEHMSLKPLYITFHGDKKQTYFPKKPYIGFNKVIVDSDELRVGQVPWQAAKEFTLTSPGKYILEADCKDYFLYKPKVHVKDQRWWEDFGWDKHTGILEMDAVWPPNDTPLWEAPIIKDDWYYHEDVNTRDPNEDYWQWRNEQEDDEEEDEEEQQEELALKLVKRENIHLHEKETRILKWDVGMGGDGGYPPWPPFDPAYPPEPDETQWWYGYRDVYVNMKQDPRVKINWNKNWEDHKIQIIGIDVLEHVEVIHEQWTFKPDEFEDNPLGPKFPEYYCGIDIEIATLINVGVGSISGVDMKQDSTTLQYWRIVPKRTVSSSGTANDDNPRWVRLYRNEKVVLIAMYKNEETTRCYIATMMVTTTAAGRDYVYANINDIRKEGGWTFWGIRTINTEDNAYASIAGCKIGWGLNDSTAVKNYGTNNGSWYWNSVEITDSNVIKKIEDALPTEEAESGALFNTLTGNTRVNYLIYSDGDNIGTGK